MTGWSSSRRATGAVHRDLVPYAEYLDSQHVAVDFIGGDEL
jgi:hypothetical protein